MAESTSQLREDRALEGLRKGELPSHCARSKLPSGRALFTLWTPGFWPQNLFTVNSNWPIFPSGRQEARLQVRGKARMKGHLKTVQFLLVLPQAGWVTGIRQERGAVWGRLVPAMSTATSLQFWRFGSPYCQDIWAPPSRVELPGLS